jgi:hypothetical protein
VGDIVTEQSESREQPEILTTHTFAPVLTGKPRRVSKLITAPSAFEGEGFPVRRAFAGLSRSDVDPFVILDQMGEVDYAPGEPKGTPWHPHRGMETFTYLLKGEFIHQDSHGGGGIIREGGTQYMTAGDGILHIETPPPALVESGGLFHGLQLWINIKIFKVVTWRISRRMTVEQWSECLRELSPDMLGQVFLIRPLQSPMYRLVLGRQ